MSQVKITVTENGPYLVTGAVPIREMYIVPKGHHMVLEEGRDLPQEEEYALCRCGGSKDKPFCDGAHETNGFEGEETASRKLYVDRIQDVTEGTKMFLADDGRCAFSRFCHTERGDIWSITERDDGPENYKLAVRAASECVAGRLTAIDKDGNVLEETSSPEIIILQDPAEESSAGIFVKGPITIVAADGTEYEVRNRVALCRCGESQNKPFCDATHVSIKFQDGHLIVES